MLGPDFGKEPLAGGSRLNTYVPLWCKSNYSFLEGASHPEELIDEAARHHLPAIGITDRSGLYGVVRAQQQAKDRGQRLLVGSEIMINSDSLLLIAQDREGYARLCTLLTKGHADQQKGQFQLSVDELASSAPGMICLWAPQTMQAIDHLSPLAEAFSDRFYAVVARHRWTDDAWRQRLTQEASRRFGVKPVAATEVLYHDRRRQGLHDVVTCIRHGVKRADAGRLLKPNDGHALLSPHEFLHLYHDQPDWVAATVEIAERCQFSLTELEYRYPEDGVPPSFGSTLEWLRHLTWEGARRRYPGGVSAVVRAQLEKELSLISDLQYSGYFLTMFEVVEFCRQQGILCQGRGSAANSAVCYCLGITAVDPVSMNLLFERFLSKERAEPPDIDLDIEHHRREEVIAFLYARYGRKRAAMVANVVRYRSRSALREVGKVLDVPAADLDRMAKSVPHYDLPTEIPRSLVEEELYDWATQLQGFPRHLSIHPGGFLLGSEPLARLVPVENATMPGRTVIQWDKTDVEAMNLFKVDLLGLGALTHLDYAFRLLREHKGQNLNMAAIPLDDSQVYDLIDRADTIGIFQIESRAQMAMLPRLRPRTYYDLVIEVSLVRPGPITGGMVHPYLRRRQGLERVSYPHPCLEPVLKKTLGIPLFQEQVMKLAMAAADYTPGEADQLRRDMAAWKSSGRIDEHHERLVERMKAKGIDADFAERVFSQIRGFGEYGFPESHAASFALIAYATAWVKTHHPEVFFCAILNAYPMGFYSPASLVADARRHQVVVEPPNLLRSQWDCILEPGESRLIVRLGLRYLRGLHKVEAERLLSLVPTCRGESLEEWKRRASVSVETWELLAVGGALSELGVPRRQALWSVLDTSDPLPIDQDPTTEFLEPSETELIEWDYQSQGLSTGAHLLAPLRPDLLRRRCQSAIEVNCSTSSGKIRHAGLVTCRQRPGNAKGVVFITLEDETGMVNVVVWQQIWNRYRRVLLTSRLLLVEGRIQNEQGVVHLMADHVESLDSLVSDHFLPGSRDFH